MMTDKTPVTAAIAENQPAPRRGKRRRILWILLILLIISVLIGLIFSTTIFKAYGQFLDVGVPLKNPVDAVLVLGGDITTRPFVAVEVFKAEYASKLLYCGVADLKDHGRMAEGTEENTLLQIIDHSGFADLPRENIGNQVNSTIDEAKALASYLKGHPQETVAVITNNYHTRRARKIFLHHCHEYNDKLYFVSAPSDYHEPTDWWQSNEGRLYYCFEGVKLLTTCLPGGMD